MLHNVGFSMIDVLLVLGAYLLGSLSSAILVCRLMGLPDPRTEGSNNPGATNVLRIGGKKAAALAFIGDSLKGLLPVLIGYLLNVETLTLGLIGIAAFLGHLYPVFFGFQGGKGVATSFGVQFGLYWPVGLISAIIWLFIAKVIRISSLSALISMGFAPIAVWLIHPEPALIVVQCLMSLLLIWRHRSNIKKLLHGKEDTIKPKIPS